jgi:hypothetical protein
MSGLFRNREWPISAMTAMLLPACFIPLWPKLNFAAAVKSGLRRSFDRWSIEDFQPNAQDDHPSSMNRRWPGSSQFPRRDQTDPLPSFCISESGIGQTLSSPYDRMLRGRARFRRLASEEIDGPSLLPPKLGPLSFLGPPPLAASCPRRIKSEGMLRSRTL